MSGEAQAPRTISMKIGELREQLVKVNKHADEILARLGRSWIREEKNEKPAEPSNTIDIIWDLLDGSIAQIDDLESKLRIIEDEIRRL